MERIGAALERSLHKFNSTTTSTNWPITTAAAEIRRRHSTISKAQVSERVRRLAYGEAMRNLTAALELLERTPSSPERRPARIRAPNQPWSALMATKGWAAPETERAYLRAERLAEDWSHTRAAVRATGWIVWTALRRRQLERSAANGRSRSGISSIATPIRFSCSRRSIMTGRWRFRAGELEAAQRHVERGLKLFESKLRSVAVPLYDRSSSGRVRLCMGRAAIMAARSSRCGAAMRGAGCFTCE